MVGNKTVYLKDYKVSNYLVEKINLCFDLYDDKTIVENEALYYKNPDSKDSNELFLNGENLKLISVFIDSKEISKKDYFLDGDSLKIKNCPDKFLLKVITEIHPEKNKTLEGLYVSGNKFTTQCESQGFRTITYYLDRPDVMSVFTTKIISDRKKYPVLLSNGNLLEKGDLDNNRHFCIWNDPFKKPSYLFALVAGDLEYIEDKFITKSSREITLRIFTEKHNIHKCDFAMQSLKKAMKWDEDRFGLEYDLDLFMIVAVDDFNHGAMENKGLNIFNSEVVFATPQTATDNDYIYIERVVGHEYFHNWTGNRVTCRDWFQLSLKEGLTVFRDQEFTADMHSRSVKRIEDVRLLRDYQFKEDSGPMSHPVRPSFFKEIRNFYTVTVYEKGAEVVRMYQTILGKDGFRKGMDLYFSRHDGQAVTTEDFLKSMGDANNIDLSQFQNWYDQAGTPILDIESKFLDDGSFKISFRQKCPSSIKDGKFKPFIIPVKYGIINENSDEINSGMFILKNKEEDFVLSGIEKGSILSINREFSSPVIINYDYSKKDYLFLMKHEKDEFNRFEASQKYFIDTFLEVYNKKEFIVEDDFIDAYKYIILDKELDNSLKAEALNIASESMLLSFIKNDLNPRKVHILREEFLKFIASNLEKELENLYNNLNLIKEYKLDKKDIGERKLKNICLKYLSYVKNPSFVYNHYKSSNNMTDTLSSLMCLTNIDCKERADALSDFYDKWKDDTNVINKWFRVQSMSNLDTTLEEIRTLETHLLFDITNPNKVRSLYGSFAMGNNKNFHKKDGSGYKFIADKVIKIDKINPQLASRLAKTLIDWKNLESKRGMILKGELERIYGIKALSSDTKEVISKSLGKN